MTTTSRLKILFVATLCWGAVVLGVSIAPFFSGDDFMAMESAYHDLRHALNETPAKSGTEQQTMEYFDGQRGLLGRTLAFHAVTSLLLTVSSAVALRRTTRGAATQSV